MSDEIQKPVAPATAVSATDETLAPVKEVLIPVSAEKSVVVPVSAVVEEELVSEKEATVMVPESVVMVAKEEEIATGNEVVQTEPLKEESYLASELPEVEKKALIDFKEIVREALNKREFSAPPLAPAKEEKFDEQKEAKTEETSAVAETKPEEKTAAPALVETEPVATASADTNKEEISAPVETKPTAPVVTEKEVEATTSAPVETKPTAPVIPETKKEEEKTAAVTIENALATKPEESIVSITLPEKAEPLEPEEISIWGIPLLKDERTDVILLKFLRARDFKVKEAFTMLKNTVQWRKDNNIDELVTEDLEGSEFEKMMFTHGVDKQGHVVIYSLYGEFQNKEIFSNEEKLNKFLKWRNQFQEKCVRSLDFSPEAKPSFMFVNDFRNAPGLGKRALWQFIRNAVKQFEDNYPEFVAKELLINVPWWYIPYYKTFGSIVTSPRTKSKMVLAGPSRSADTIFKYVAPEVVPVKYGGLSKESIFTVEDGVTEAVVKSSAKHTIELPASEACTISWELRVLGADVSYGAQFEPSNEASYTLIVSKNRKIGLTDEPVITDSFKATEPGKIVITIDNQTFKKTKLLYRFKTQA